MVPKLECYTPEFPKGSCNMHQVAWVPASMKLIVKGDSFCAAIKLWNQNLVGELDLTASLPGLVPDLNCCRETSVRD